jgi:hypothetical protein
MADNSEVVLSALYQRFFEKHESFSDVTSSHWRKVGWHTASLGQGVWKLKGAGFGDWMEDNLLNRLRTFGVGRAIAGLRQAHACPESLWRLGMEVAKSQRRIFSYDCAKQVLALAKVARSIAVPDSASPLTSAGISKVCVIGDGYGYLGSLLKAFDRGVTVTSVNLGRGLLFDAYYTRQCFPDAVLAVLDPKSAQSADFLFLPAEDYAALQSSSQDMVFNIASMQEMNLAVVRNYVRYIRRQDGNRTLFYCCNRIEKTLPDGDTVRFDDYGWDTSDTVVFDELCPWYQAFPHGLLAQWLPFDGPIKHRLAYLHAAKDVNVAPTCG